MSSTALTAVVKPILMLSTMNSLRYAGGGSFQRRSLAGSLTIIRS